MTNKRQEWSCPWPHCAFVSLPRGPSPTAASWEPVAGPALEVAPCGVAPRVGVAVGVVGADAVGAAAGAAADIGAAVAGTECWDEVEPLPQPLCPTCAVWERRHRWMPYPY